MKQATGMFYGTIHFPQTHTKKGIQTEQRKRNTEYHFIIELGTDISGTQLK